MKELNVIPHRLKVIASYLPKGTIFADIGSDHAHLPIYICSRDISARAIAVEVNEGPLHSAQQNISNYQFSDVIDARLGDGLSVIEKNEVTEVVVAGMGGSLITSILENGVDMLKSIKRIIVQPNIQARKIRKWADLNDMHVVAEEVIKENGHFYEIIVLEQGLSLSELNLSDIEKEKQYIFGPFLLENKSDSFIEKWTEEQKKLSQIIAQMNRAQIRDEVKIRRFQKELKWIKEVLS